MKIIYSQLQKLLPKLKEIDVKIVANKLSWLGHFCSGLEYTKNDVILDLEVRQNRADCLGYFGLASDLAPIYGPISFQDYQIKKDNSLPPTPVTINSADVLRIQSLTISNLKNSPSPNWLKNFLNNHNINSINCLVDLSNYIMLLYGIPCHTFDANKVNNQLTWQNNSNFDTFTTLDGTKLKLIKDNLLITNQKKVVSLSFIGGLNSGVDLNTTDTIIEMAVYNRSQVRSDSRQLKTITEASIRLDKYLDCNLIPQAFAHLSHLIVDLLGGQISTKLLDYYPTPQTSPAIKLNLSQISAIAGVDVPNDFCLDILSKLNCQLQNQSTRGLEDYIVTPPTIRKDINIEEDVVEEIIRYYGYDNIPTNQPISLHKTTDITPKVLYLIKHLKDQLVKFGYDEIRSWPLIQQKHILEDLLDPKQQPIYTQNSINSKYPVLRPTIISSLINQYQQYKKYKLDNTPFFEIGKIFYQVDQNYIEKYSLGIFNPQSDRLRQDIKKLNFSKANKQLSNHTGLYLEFILDDINTSSIDIPNYHQQNSQAIVELTSQIVNLDANVTFKTKQDSDKLIGDYSQKIGKYLWQITITDIFENKQDGTYKYTFNVSYYNLSSSKAKKLHLNTFNLN